MKDEAERVEKGNHRHTSWTSLYSPIVSRMSPVSVRARTPLAASQLLSIPMNRESFPLHTDHSRRNTADSIPDYSERSRRSSKGNERNRSAEGSDEVEDDESNRDSTDDVDVEVEDGVQSIFHDEDNPLVKRLLKEIKKSDTPLSLLYKVY